MKKLLLVCLLSRSTQNDVWVDPDSKLMWAAADNGSGVSWRQAMRYCRESAAAGFSDWRLPDIEQLQAIYDATGKSHTAFHIKGNLKLTGWQWSATPGQQIGESWAFDFGDGGRASVAGGDSGLNRALCVRGGN